MHTGKVSEAVLKRSVLRQLNIETAAGGAYGADCGIFVPGSGSAHGADRGMDFAGGEDSVLACAVSGPVPGFEWDPGKQVTAAANNLAAGGAAPEALMIQAAVPPDYEEPALQRDMRRIREAAAVHGMAILGGHTEVSAFVKIPQYFVTGLGRIPAGSALEKKRYQDGRPAENCQGQDEDIAGNCRNQKKTGEKKDGVCAEFPGQATLRPGWELVLTKWIGLGGTAALAIKYEEELKRRYPFTIIDQAKKFEGSMSVVGEARAVVCFGGCAMHDLSQGGIFGALWEMAARAGVGLEVDLKRIPIKQETIEICEFFDINPYCLYSAGSLLVGTDRAEALTAQLHSLGIEAAVIGRTTEGNDRIIRNDSEVRFLDRPGQDEWYRMQEERARRIENERADFNIS